MPRWLAHALVAIGWLLTPGWAWGAAFLGAWAGARLSAGWSDPVAMLAATAGAAAAASLGGLWVWVRVMRRLPHWLSRRMAPRQQAEAKVAPVE